MQGLLELAGVAYVGAGVLGSAVGMDKDVAKRLLRDAGIPIVDFAAGDGGRDARRPAAALAPARRSATRCSSSRPTPGRRWA